MATLYNKTSPGYVPITYTSALLLKSNHEIPQKAKIVLDQYCIETVRRFKLATKQFKYTFPFYEKMEFKKASIKYFSLVYKSILRKVPYLVSAKIPFMSFPVSTHRIQDIIIRLGPAQLTTDGIRKGEIIVRYVRYLSFLITKYNLPITLNHSGRLIYEHNPENRYFTPEERKANSYEVYDIYINFSSTPTERELGYLLFFYYTQIEKVLLTLHRLAHYADSTYQT